ncbi:MAG TPA: hypothetical protein VNR11_08665 [Xanthobacteraceae bacterium]|nr:hypothetical protein [Xanthobacteraceae bacterium]
MGTYRVCFYKELLSSDGHPFKCLQARVEVGDVDSGAQAADSACRIFEASQRIRHWALNADTLEVEAVDPAVSLTPPPSHGGVSAMR